MRRVMMLTPFPLEAITTMMTRPRSAGTARAVNGPHPTTVIRSPRLSDALGCDLTVVSEAFQYTGSFKFRAAWHVVHHVPQSSVITASSGNFGQAIAYACHLTGKHCTVVMPHN